MAKLILILGDQLSHSISSLSAYNKSTDIILMCEVMSEAEYVKHHKKKIAFIFAAMRHFAIELKAKGYNLHYTKLNDKNNKGSFTGEVSKLVTKYKIIKIVVTHPGEYRVLAEINSWQKQFGLQVIICPDNRFLSTMDQFKSWAQNRKQLRMEYFYRDMRREHSILLNQGKPISGKWNFDAENRKPVKSNLTIPKPYTSKIDAITREVLELVEAKFANNFGDLYPFQFAVTRKQALFALKKFIKERLVYFGDYQDAMLAEDPWMYHSHISLYLNIGLLLPKECILAAEQAYYNKQIPINAAEGFIRQILGWREYVRGIYWLKMPGYAKLNFFNARRKLPEFYWSADTKMNCIKQCVTNTKNNAYAHHIQRLMVLGNFALLAGIDPEQVNNWFLIVYADAYEWVELPNVSGMILFADGGYLASKPYASGGNYINKMSNYCKNCYYQVNNKYGDNACPFNYLYWDFLVRNKNKLSDNQRLAMIYKTYEKMSAEKQLAIKKSSSKFLQKLTIMSSL